MRTKQEAESKAGELEGANRYTPGVTYGVDQSPPTGAWREVVAEILASDRIEALSQPRELSVSRIPTGPAMGDSAGMTPKRKG